MAPDLRDRLERFDPAESGKDLFASYRVDEQIAKGLDRKVWLPSGGSLIIDRTEAMTVVDVNTGKFTGSGGNLEETVTKNNLEAAEEMVRQLRLRDIGGIIVIDFIDMVLESNRDLVLRRLVECLGRDRTRHQVAEVTSLGLVQMTRKRIGTGLLEAFSTDCEHCKGRGLVLHDHPVESGGGKQDDEPRGRRNRGGRNRGRGGAGDDNGDRNGSGGGAAVKPSPADLANSRPPEKQADEPASEPEAEPATGADEQPEKSVIGKPASSAPEPQQVPTESGATDDAASRRCHARAGAEPTEPEPAARVRSRGAPPGHQHPPSYGAAPGRATTHPGRCDGADRTRRLCGSWPASDAVGRARGHPRGARSPRSHTRGRAGPARRGGGRHPDPRRPDLARRSPNGLTAPPTTSPSRTRGGRRPGLRRRLPDPRPDQAQGIPQALSTTG